MSEWVRFADTKATILAASLGVAVPLASDHIAEVVRLATRPGIDGRLLAVLCALTALDFVFTLGWLVSALAPRGRTSTNQPNRFAWPSMAQTTGPELARHLDRTAMADDAWRQVLDLAVIAGKKYKATTLAVRGFGCLIALAAATVITAVLMSS